MSTTTTTAMADAAEAEATIFATATTGKLSLGACYRRDGNLMYSHESPETLWTQAERLWDFAAACRGK